jgi:3-hydroxyacyl-CoA dehydrogenase
MRLLEIVRGARTAPAVLATALAFAKRIGKIGVVSGVCRGFIGNRMLQGYVREAGLLVLEGASPRQVDDALTGFGMAMGPFAVGDLAGLDVSYMARRALDPRDYETRAFVVADRLVEAGRKGQKTGAGWYRYEPCDRSPQDDPAVGALIDEARRELGVVPRVPSTDEIVERCIYALIVEGARILDDGISYRASDIDVVYVNGYGFPRYRGGPMRYALEVGLDRVAASAEDFARRFGLRWWTPPGLLLRAAREGFWPKSA